MALSDIMKQDKAAQEAMDNEEEDTSGPVEKIDIFKERIEAEARVLKLEKELKEAQKVFLPSLQYLKMF